jgi:osomolarity two-component system phosphorelay intermediate protein YPD1
MDQALFVLLPAWNDTDYWWVSHYYSVEKDLEQLASLGHFLKGSSATLGLVKVKDHCEKIQHFGGKKDATGTCDIPEDDKCLDAIQNALQNMKKEYEKVEVYFQKLYPSEVEQWSVQLFCASAWRIPLFLFFFLSVYWVSLGFMKYSVDARERHGDDSLNSNGLCSGLYGGT